MLQLDLTFHLFVCALAGAGAAVIAMVRTITLIIFNWLMFGAGWYDRHIDVIYRGDAGDMPPPLFKNTIC